jgi:hypothetical protein
VLIAFSCVLQRITCITCNLVLQLIYSTVLDYYGSRFPYLKYKPPEEHRIFPQRRLFSLSIKWTVFYFLGGGVHFTLRHQYVDYGPVESNKNDRCIGKDLEGMSDGQIETLSRGLPEGPEKTLRNSVSIDNVPAEFRVDHSRIQV